MDVKDFYFDLPQELIAQDPLEDRSSSRLLVLDKKTGKTQHRIFKDIVEYLRPGDCLVINDTKVIPARLFGVKKDTGAKIEVLLLKRRENDIWETLVKPGKKAKPGTVIDFGDGILTGTVIETVDDGNRLIQFSYEGIFEEILDRLGQMPLPPYITHQLKDKNRYQTVYAVHEGSAAAPTAGLHFTKELLKQIEDMGVKKTTFQELDKIAKPECIFASNTSSLSITEIGNGLTRPMVGMHFFNPADRMKLIEVIAGVNTPDETVEAIKKISVEIGKTPVQVNEAAGFVVNRILIPMINEAAFIKMEGVSDIAGIDAAMKLGANHPMGPLELGDFIGLDICLAIMDVLYKETGDSKYRACPLIRKMVRGGNLGAKSGKGFYVYNADRTKTPVDAQ